MRILGDRRRLPINLLSKTVICPALPEGGLLCNPQVGPASVFHAQPALQLQCHFRGKNKQNKQGQTTVSVIAGVSRILLMYLTAAPAVRQDDNGSNRKRRTGP